MTKQELSRCFSSGDTSNKRSGCESGHFSKLEFIQMLRIALNGKVSPGQVTENMRYYEDYINVEIRKGRSEEEVLAALGDPRLIARTIVETGNGKDGGNREHAGRGGQYGGSAEYVNGSSGQYGGSAEYVNGSSGRYGGSAEYVNGSSGRYDGFAEDVDEGGGRYDGFSGYADGSYGQYGGWEQEGYNMRRRRGQTLPKILSRIPLWAWLAFALLIVVMILGVIFSVLTALLPVLLPVLGIIFLLKLFRKWKG